MSVSNDHHAPRVSRLAALASDGDHVVQLATKAVHQREGVRRHHARDDEHEVVQDVAVGLRSPVDAPPDHSEWQ